MNPWTPIGWIVLAALVLPVIFGLLAFVVRVVLHFKTRNTPAAPGQCWTNGSDSYWIKRADEHCVTFDTANASITIAAPEWTARVRGLRLYLDES